MSGAAEIDAEVSYDRDGLVPCVVQDWRTGEVLTLAYMNAAGARSARATPASCTCAAARAASSGTRAPRAATSRRVRALRLDCDGDTLLALVEPAGPACHTGERTCFHRGALEPGAPHETLPELERTLAAARRASARRAPTPSSCSTTRSGSARR